MTRRLRTELIDPLTTEPILANRLIPPFTFVLSIIFTRTSSNPLCPFSKKCAYKCSPAIPLLFPAIPLLYHPLFRVKIIDKTNVNNPTTREGFWAYKLDSFIPWRLNIRDFFVK